MPQTRVSRVPDPIGIKDPDGAGVYPATMGNQELTHRLLNFPYIGEFHNIWEARFFEHDPNFVLDVSAGGTASSIPGGARFTTDNASGVTFTAVMREANRYAADHTMGYAGTFDFHTAPLGTGEYEFGALDAARENGITLYQTASTIGLRRYFDSTTPVEDIDIAFWNLKPGGTGIYKDDNGDGTALDLTKRHILRIGVGKWLGNATLLVLLEPEDHTVPPVAVHAFRFNNRSHESSLATPNLPMQQVMRTGDTAQILHTESGCWVVGNDSPDRIPVISESNSTTTPAAFTGKFISTINHPFTRVVLDCDVDGDLDVSWSDDGDTVVYQEPTFEFDAADGAVARNYAARAEFIKVDFTPASAPATLRLTTTLTGDVATSPLMLLKESMGRGKEVVPTASAMFALDGTVTRAMTGTVADGLDVDVTRLPGTVAADILASRTALEVIDDWDESDRAKVNPIVGQAGVAADAGATGANVQRVVQANPVAGASTNPTAGATASTILAADNHRVSAIVTNEGVGNARVAVGGTVPTASLGRQLLPGDSIVIPGGPEVQVIREAAVDVVLQVSEVKHA